MFNYSSRIKKLQELAGRCDVLGDVGTDHALVPIYMVENGLCTKAIASDLNQGPLRKASDNVRRSGLRDKITLRLGEGLTPYVPGDCDVYVIAGMGGTLIAEILEQSPEVAHRADKLILQPNTCRAELRRFLNENGYEILDEDCAAEKKHIYVFLTVKYTGCPPKALSHADLEMGAALQNKPEGVLYFRALYEKMYRKLVGLKHSYNVPADEIKAVKDLMAILEDYI